MIKGGINYDNRHANDIKPKKFFDIVIIPENIKSQKKEYDYIPKPRKEKLERDQRHGGSKTSNKHPRKVKYYNKGKRMFDYPFINGGLHYLLQQIKGHQGPNDRFSGECYCQLIPEV